MPRMKKIDPLQKIKNETTRREMQLLALVAGHCNRIEQKYPATASHFADMHAAIIALTIDWD